jgi:hypothetical protein
VTASELREVKCDANTRCPGGFDPPEHGVAFFEQIGVGRIVQVLTRHNESGDSEWRSVQLAERGD